MKVPLELFLERDISAAGGPQQNQALAEELCGKVVAIDVTQWIFQALDGQRRAAFSGPNEVAKSVVALCISRVRSRRVLDADRLASARQKCLSC